MRSVTQTAGTVLTAALLAAACAPSADEDETLADEQAQPTAEAPTTTAAPPDTTVEGLWAHLEEEAYRDNWQMWPGKDRLYPGTEPHGMLLTTYANQTAYEALLNGQVADLPPGSIIVKENWMPDSTFDAATVMYRVEGYNPDHQDWLFAKYNAEGEPDAFGRAPMCQACHQSAETGYIYTAVER